METNKFKLIEANIPRMIRYGFKKIEDCYVYSFVVYKNCNKDVLMCKLICNVEENAVFIDVVDINTGGFYAPYYNREFGDFSYMLNHINNQIKKEKKKLESKNILIWEE